MTHTAHPETSTSELISRIERQREIICDLLVKNEHLRNRLRQIERGTRSNQARHGEIAAAPCFAGAISEDSHIQEPGP